MLNLASDDPDKPILSHVNNTPSTIIDSSRDYTYTYGNNYLNIVDNFYIVYLVTLLRGI